ncbi:MAG: hypothetical protein AAB445_01885 [Patescibacteria group bacterium]
MKRLSTNRKAMLLLVVVALALGAYSCAKKLIGPSDPQTTSTPVLTLPDNSSTLIDSAEERKDQMQPAAAAINWNSLNAMSKRQLILETGYAENGTRQAPNCKIWAQAMVTRASGGAASLPTTVNNGYGYYFTSLSHVTQVLQNQPNASYTYFLPGRVLQMWYGGPNKPHTAFIYSSSPSGMQWLDCNFVGGAGNGIVGIHSISWAEFRQKVPNFTLYEVY